MIDMLILSILLQVFNLQSHASTAPGDKCDSLFRHYYSIRAKSQEEATSNELARVEVPAFYIGNRETLQKDLIRLAAALCPGGYFGPDFFGDAQDLEFDTFLRHKNRFESYLKLNGIDPELSTFKGVPLAAPKQRRSKEYKTWLKLWKQIFENAPCFYFEDLWKDPNFTIVAYDYPGERVQGELWRRAPISTQAGAKMPFFRNGKRYKGQFDVTVEKPSNPMHALWAIPIVGGLYIGWKWIFPDEVEEEP